MSIKSAVTQTIARQKFKVKRNTPHILFVGGIVGVAASTVLACRATLKLEAVVDKAKEEIDEVKASVEKEYVGQKDLAYTYCKNTVKIVELYAPALAVGTASIVALTGAHVQLTRRNAALTAAYTGLHAAYSEYRDRVRARFGTDTERDIFYGVKEEETEDEKGKLKTVKTVDVNNLSVYAKFFDEANPNWQKDPELNRLFVQCQQNYANHRLQSKGHLFLNEVYDSLGIDRSRAGQVVGWLLNSEGDNYIDFGIFEAHQSPFVNGYERSILLDFNVDGVIYDKI